MRTICMLNSSEVIFFLCINCAASQYFFSLTSKTETRLPCSSVSLNIVFLKKSVFFQSHLWTRTTIWNCFINIEWMQMMEHIVLAKPCENQREEFVTKSQRNMSRSSMAFNMTHHNWSPIFVVAAFHNNDGNLWIVFILIDTYSTHKTPVGYGMSFSFWSFSSDLLLLMLLCSVAKTFLV